MQGSVIRIFPVIAIGLGAIIVPALSSSALAQTVYIGGAPLENTSPVEKKIDGEIKQVFVRYFASNDHENGYRDAEIKLNYRFISCMGELHVAYSLDSGSVTASKVYYRNRKAIDASSAPLPVPPSIGFNAKVREGGPLGQARGEIAAVGDAFAGPALGYGCFTGQSQKVGQINKWLGARPAEDKIQTFLNNLYLDDAFVVPVEPLRNFALEVPSGGQRKSAPFKPREEPKDKPRPV